MMNRTIARDYVAILLLEVRPLLSKIWKSGRDLDGQRIFLKSVHSRLDKACNHFETTGAAEDHEDLYLPLFFALSHLSTALGLKTIRSQFLGSAIGSLEGLAKLLARDPAGIAKKGGAA